MAADDDGDELGFVELLVANDRIGRWLDVLGDPYQRAKHSHALSHLHQDLQKGRSYVEEANRLGAVPILTKLLASTGDEATLDAISSMIAVCSGPMASGGKVSSFSYGAVTVHIREGALGDGLGAQVWSVCHIMARELLAHPEIVRGQQVLELGSGTGLLGLVAALAGARQAVLTDHEDKVLLNLRTCMHMNTAAAAAAVAAAAAAAAAVPAGGPAADGPDQQQQQHEVPNDAELFDEAESVDDLDLGGLVLRPQQVAAAGAAPGGGSSDDSAAAVRHAELQSAWEADNMLVRVLDWAESERELLLHAGQQEQEQQRTGQQQQQQLAAQGCGAPRVPLQQRFPVILGNEVMYEPAHARLVAAAIRHRLQPHGRALLCCAVRVQAVFAAFRDSCRRWALTYRAVRVHAAQDGGPELGGVGGPEADYEGGFLLMAVEHAAAPARAWHRADFVEV